MTEDTKRRNVILADKYILELLKACGYSTERVARVVIDAVANEPVKIYIQYYGTDALLDAGFPDGEIVDVSVIAPNSDM